MKINLINAICLAFPSGQNLWLNAQKGREYVRQVVDEWHSANPEYQGSDCTMGLIEIRMPEEQFNQIQNDDFNWPDA